VERFGVDPLRYFVMREMVVGQDASFADETFLTRYNADLANDLGNVVSRVTTMIQRYCDGMVPEARAGADVELTAAVSRTVREVAECARRVDFSTGLRAIWDLISILNKFIVTREPWALAKKPDARPMLEQTLYDAADTLRVIAALVEPVMPATAERIRRMLNVESEGWSGLRPGTLPAGRRLGTIEPLFPRMEQTVEELRAMAGETPGDAPSVSQPVAANPQTPAAAPAPASAAGGDRITIDDFMKVDLRVAKVLAAEKVPNSRKLVKLSIDVGTEQRTLVAGIAESYEPEALVGRTIVMVFNLKPAKLMGVESNGMVLAASPEGGKPTLVGFEAEVAPGTRVR
jgi:methionyl-tRNA synthetase